MEGAIINAIHLRNQRVDYAASLLFSLWIITGAVVIALLVALWTLPAIDNPITADESGRDDHAFGFALDVEPPGLNEAEVLNELSLGESLAAITDVASSVAATAESSLIGAEATSVGKEKGDGRPAGPLGEAEDVVPRHERWELRVAAAEITSYAVQLDHYKIELGCVGKSKLVDYGSGLSRSPEMRRGKGSEEKRLYFMWRQEGPLANFDRQLLRQAGFQTEGRQVLKFIPKNLEARLYHAEMRYANGNGHHRDREIAKTVFESRPASSGFEFVVIEQRYRAVK